MKFRLDFSVDAWIQSVEIEAANEKEALEKLNEMKLDEIIEEGSVKDFRVHQVDSEVIEKTVEVHAFNIKYDFDDIMEQNIDPNSLPTELNFEVEDVVEDDDLDSDVKYALDDELFSKYSIFADTFDYEITGEK